MILNQKLREKRTSKPPPEAILYNFDTLKVESFQVPNWQ